MCMKLVMERAPKKKARERDCMQRGRWGRGSCVWCAVCRNTNAHVYNYLLRNTNMHVYAYLCNCVCVCVCAGAYIL